MPAIPRATTVVQDTAGIAAAGLDVLCVWAPCATAADMQPRLFGSAQAIYEKHGYNQGVPYAALHERDVKKPILFVALPIETEGAVSGVVVAGNTDTSVVSVAAGADGVLDEHDGIVRVLVGGTIGTDQIKFALSLDGGRKFKTIRLGTANSYVVPYFGVTISFAAGDLTAGETVITWHGSAPRAATADFQAAREALAAQQKGFRSILLCQDLQSDTEALAYNTELDAYETANERFVYGRASVYDRAAGDTKAEWMAEIDAEFASVDDKFRIDLAAGRGRVTCPFTGWHLRRSAAWAASLREYQHDLHIATWRKSDGPTLFDLFDEDGVLVEWDDRVDGEAASAARFTSLRTWANGPAGAFVALSLTRAQEGSLLGLTHNVAVVNLACTTVQLNTENAAIGVSLILNPDGTASAASLASVKSQVDNALELALLTNRGEGQRASAASWTPDANVLFNVPTPIMLGTTDLLLNGTVHSVRTAVRVQTAG